MKYLKTFEILNEGFEVVKKIKKWMKDNNLDGVDLLDIRTLRFRGGEEWPYYFRRLLIDDNGEYNLLGSFSEEEKCDELYFDRYGDPSWPSYVYKNILKYLERLTPEKIEMERIKNEAEKFNL